MRPYEPARKSLMNWRPTLGQQAAAISPTKPGDQNVPAPQEMPLLLYAAVTVGVIFTLWVISMTLADRHGD
jgi:hypothetical protein